MYKPTRQPEPNQCHQDASGALVTVHSVLSNHVTFYRDGYSSPCKQPVERFIRKFTEVKP
ncbi:DUF4222 domain-containing protein [Chimaeribacter coloradensis]|uniref:DUF4222 domain-containing protein n=1 Tax=Chimaeribacter coloradensis TaxID=2060068 RepID=A0A2N5DYN4_9GAMM|nr:DUF4222 domain-containing protein [Chimaeribacter coloradensis]PLR32675.1 DUF4222 domain-containing protein [Chimaeribacter coloradensis]